MLKFEELEFVEAANSWLEIHKRYIAPRTVRDYKQYIRALSKFFGGRRLDEIQIGDIRDYQKGREVVPTLVNMELSCLQQILKEAKLWDQIASFYRPLPTVRTGSGKSLSSAEEEELLQIAFSGNKKWLLAAHCLQLMLRTGCGFGEIRGVRRCDVDLDKKVIAIIEAKNEYRERTVPLSPRAMESIRWLLERWRRLGGHKPEEYVLPHNGRYGQKGTHDVSRPMYGIGRAWDGIRKAWADKAQTPEDHHRRLTFRIYDMRVTAITKTLSTGKVSVHTAKRLFGHVSEQMQRRYFKPDLDTMREAVNLLDGEASA